jgi:hypothetical protein
MNSMATRRGGLSVQSLFGMQNSRKTYKQNKKNCKKYYKKKGYKCSRKNLVKYDYPGSYSLSGVKPKVGPWAH